MCNTYAPHLPGQRFRRSLHASVYSTLWCWACSVCDTCFVFTSSEKGRGVVKWEGKGQRKRQRKKGEGMEKREMWMQENSPKTQHGIWRCPLWLPPQVIQFRKDFSRAKFALQTVCLCLESFRSYLALKLKILKNIQKFNIYGFSGKLLAFWGSYWGLPPSMIHCRHLFSHATFPRT